MKKDKFRVVLLLLLAAFFLAWTLAEFFYTLGMDKVPEKGLQPLRAAMRLFPIAAAYPGEAGFALMEKGTRDNDPALVKAAMPYFRKALARNPLDYRSRYYLAKAYLRLSAVDNDFFDRGVAELKRAARVRGGNRQIAIDCSKVFFSQWPLLEEEDQRFAADLLARTMPALSWEDFSPLLEMWTLYVQEPELLNSLLRERPDFYGPAANQLLSSAIPLPWRWQLLDLYEQYSLDAGERLFNEKRLNNELDRDQAAHILRHLAVRGYFRLHPGSQFKPDKLEALQRQLLLEIIAGMLADPGQAASAQLREYVERYVHEHAALSALKELQQLLSEGGYFKENDFPSLRIKTLIANRVGDHAGVIAEVEALRKGISFVKKEQAADYTDILLLLVDSHYSSKLMTAAEAVAGELAQEQPDNTDVLWRVLRVRKILGSEGAPDKALEEKLARVENSRFITVSRTNETFAAYLFGQPQIEITPDPALREKLKPGQLLQVFVDGWIAFESYAEGLPEKIVVGPPFVEIESKVKVQVNVQ
jgi:hypothetical protein